MLPAQEGSFFNHMRRDFELIPVKDLDILKSSIIAEKREKKTKKSLAQSALDQATPRSRLPSLFTQICL